MAQIARLGTFSDPRRAFCIQFNVCYIAAMMMVIIQTAVNNLRPVPTRKPRKAPSAAVVELRPSLLPQLYSATKAPIRPPRIIPIGVKIIPRIIPMVEPHTAALLPPVNFVILAGTMKSMMVTATVIPSQSHNFWGLMQPSK